MITSRENLFKVFRHEKPDWIPVIGVADPYQRFEPEDAPTVRGEKFGHIDWESRETTAVLSRHFGFDILDCCSGLAHIKQKNVEVIEKKEGGQTVKIYHTPGGDLTETVVNSRNDKFGPINYHTEHMVKTPGDLEPLCMIFEDMAVSPNYEKMETAKIHSRFVGESGMVRTPVWGTPLGLMYRRLSGVETLAYLWNDARDELLDVFKVIENICLQWIQIAVKSDVDIITAVDDTSTTVISPAMFEACNMELIDKRADIAHRNGKFYFHHSCGLIRNLLPLYRKTKIDAVHEFTVPPVGDVSVGEGRGLLGDAITICASLSQFGGSREVRNCVEKIIQDSMPWDHLILDAGPFSQNNFDLKNFVIECCAKLEKNQRGTRPL